MDFYKELATLTFAIIDNMIAPILFISLIVTVDKKNNVKLTLSLFTKTLSQYKSTLFYISILMIFSIGYFYFSNYSQDIFIQYLASQEIKLIPIFITTVGFAGFWTAKILIGRDWDNKAVTIFGMILLIGIILWLLFILVLQKPIASK